MVACAHCIGGTYWIWVRADTGAQEYIEQECRVCLGMGNVPRHRPGMEGIILSDMKELSITEAPVTWNTLVTLSKSPTVPERYNGKPADMLAAALKGREMGVQPMEAISSIYLVNGRASMEGRLMIALVLAAGHIITVTPTVTKATVKGKRWHKQSGEWVDMGSITFSAEDAKRAGLHQKGTYKQYPQVMLAWRAVSMACRLWFADVISGIGYVPEEIGLDVEVEEIPAEVIEMDADEQNDHTEVDALVEEAEVIDE